jgi:hypothetical protein
MNDSKLDKFMMATKAIHKLGDISNDTPDICHIHDEDENNYIGNWIYGFGFIDVKFPKETTRELTAEEIEKYHGTPWGINGAVTCALNLKGEDFRKHVTLTHKDTNKSYSGELICPIKVGQGIYMVRDDGRCFSSSTVKSITGDLIQTRNSVYIAVYDEVVA